MTSSTEIESRPRSLAQSRTCACQDSQSSLKAVSRSLVWAKSWLKNPVMADGQQDRAGVGRREAYPSDVGRAENDGLNLGLGSRGALAAISLTRRDRQDRHVSVCMHARAEAVKIYAAFGSTYFCPSAI